MAKKAVAGKPTTETQTGRFYYHCGWHASHYVKVMPDQIFGENNFQYAN
jgi:adenine specific DNA methylase Mod